MEFLDHDDPDLRSILFLHDPSADEEAKGIAEATRGDEEGDKVVTAGGIYGEIKEVQDAAFIITIAKDVTIKVSKESVFADASDAASAEQK